MAIWKPQSKHCISYYMYLMTSKCDLGCQLQVHVYNIDGEVAVNWVTILYGSWELNCREGGITNYSLMYCIPDSGKTIKHNTNFTGENVLINIQYIRKWVYVCAHQGVVELKHSKSTKVGLYNVSQITNSHPQNEFVLLHMHIAGTVHNHI